MLFVHGFPLDHEMWRHQIDALTPNHRVIAPDLRGFGGSEDVRGSVTMEQFADDLAGLLDALGVGVPVTVCGLSMGGYVALAFVRKYADRLAGLILCDTRALSDSEEAIANRRKLAKSVLANGSEVAARGMPVTLFAPATLEERPELVESVAKTIRATDPKSIAAALRGMAERPDSTALLEAITVPTLVIVGEHDTLTPAAEMRGMSERIPESRFVEVAAAGHMTPMENPDAVNRAIGEFLATIG